MISHKHKCIFIHIPKTAGTSIEKKFGLFNKIKDGVQDHRTIREIEPLSYNHLNNLHQQDNLYILLKRIRNVLLIKNSVTKKEYDSYFKFTFIRNSWSRTYSAYKNVLRDNLHKKELGITGDCTFKDFLKNYSNKWPLRSQLFWLNNSKGEIPLDFIGRFENLEEDFSHVCNILGIKDKDLPKLIIGNGQHYTQFYEDDTKELVAIKYQKEISLFNFEFGQ